MFFVGIKPAKKYFSNNECFKTVSCERDLEQVSPYGKVIKNLREKLF